MESDELQRMNFDVGVLSLRLKKMSVRLKSEIVTKLSPTPQSINIYPFEDKILDVASIKSASFII